MAKWGARASEGERHELRAPTPVKTVGCSGQTSCTGIVKALLEASRDTLDKEAGLCNPPSQLEHTPDNGDLPDIG